MTAPVTTSLAVKISGNTVERLGFPFQLLLIYLVMEYARPANPMKIPLVISALLFLYWLMLPQKNWSPQIICFILLLCIIGAMGPFAINSYAIFWGFKALAVQLLCVSVPIIHFVISLRKLSIFIHGLILVFLYVAIFGLLHAGKGPGGHIGDENDLALALNMIIPFAFVSIFLTRHIAQKTFFGGAFALMVSGVIATYSRGGFLGLVPVLLYCLVVSPKKKLAGVIGIFLAMGVWMYTPETFWAEMGTIWEEAKDPELGTGGLRRDFWRIALNMFYHNPMFGVGYENFSYNVPSYQLEEQVERRQRGLAGSAAHSIYLSVLAELGMAGALIFGAIIWYNVKDIQSIFRQVRMCGDKLRSRNAIVPAKMNEELLHDLTKARNYAHAISASFVGYLVSGMFLSVFAYPHFWILTALTVALKVGVTARLRQATEDLDSAQGV